MPRAFAALFPFDLAQQETADDVVCDIIESTSFPAVVVCGGDNVGQNWDQGGQWRQ